MKNIIADGWSEYALLDSGNRQKLERFGSFIIARPEPQALWDTSTDIREWRSCAQAFFKQETDKNKKQHDRGDWIKKHDMPEQWYIHYNYNNMQLRMRLRLTSFSHVGIFPEQAANWNYIYDKLTSSDDKEKTVLNLFAYTGGASLAAKAAGADVVHVDSVRQMINWAKENMESSNLQGIRWVVEDAIKFVRREQKRGKKYNGIILDPPAYGRGPEGEKWLLEDDINEMMKICGFLLKDNDAFFILNLYSMGFSSLIASNLVAMAFGNKADIENGELYLMDAFSKKLPLGVYARFCR